MKAAHLLEYLRQTVTFCSQDAGLRPIDESLAKLHNNYLTMGEALDSTRHYMPIENIVIGDEGTLIYDQIQMFTFTEHCIGLQRI